MYDDISSYNVVESTTAGSISRTPRIRESSIQLTNVDIKMYESMRSRDAISAPATDPLLAKFVDLDVTKGIREAKFIIHVPAGEPFLAIDGSSFK